MRRLPKDGSVRDAFLYALPRDKNPADDAGRHESETPREDSRKRSNPRGDHPQNWRAADPSTGGHQPKNWSFCQVLLAVTFKRCRCRRAGLTADLRSVGGCGTCLGSIGSFVELTC